MTRNDVINLHRTLIDNQGDINAALDDYDLDELNDLYDACVEWGFIRLAEDIEEYIQSTIE